MKANEIRIGNWILWKGPSHDENALVSAISKEEVIFKCGDSGLITECEPIPLTEEWLMKFGFEEEMMSYNLPIDLFGGGKRLTFSGDYLFIIDSEKQNTIPTDVITLWNKDVMKNFYVHQLQNLYFALVGEELTIKKDKL